jgi:hypothetical protein
MTQSDAKARSRCTSDMSTENSRLYDFRHQSPQTNKQQSTNEQGPRQLRRSLVVSTAETIFVTIIHNLDSTIKSENGPNSNAYRLAPAILQQILP